MTVVFIVNGSTSPWSRPADWVDAGHTVNLLGMGGRGGAATANSTTARPGTGGGGGAHCLLTYSSGSLGATMTFRVPANNTSASDVTTNGATCWGSATFANTNYVQGGAAGNTTSTSTAGGLAGNATTVSTGSPPAPVYTATQKNNGGAGGAGVAALTSGTGGGGAGGPTGVGGAGGTCGTVSFGGGGGGASNNGGAGANAASTTGGRGGNTGGLGGTSGSPAGGAGAATTGQGGGGGFFNASGNVVAPGGIGGDEDIWTQSSDNTKEGPGGGGGGGGGDSANSAGQVASGGDGAIYGGGGGGPGALRSTGTQTQGVGASGLIAVTYTGRSQGSATLGAGAGISASYLTAKFVSSLLAAGSKMYPTTLNVDAGSGALEAWWDFISSANDATGNAHNGTLHGTTLTTDPAGLAARSFNGTTDYIDGSTSPLEP